MLLCIMNRNREVRIKRIDLKDAFIILLLLFIPLIANAQRQMESIDRGLVAIKSGTNSVYLGWRLSGSESDTLGFNLYRITGGGSAVKMNSSPLKGATNYLDNSAVSGTTYTYYVTAIEGGIEQNPSDTVDVWAANYIDILLNRPAAGTTPSAEVYTYSPNDVSTGDLDGDGKYDLVLKWDPSNSKDNSQSGYTGNVFLDGMKLDGTMLWRIDLGKNIRAGAHYTQFMVYDLNGDGKAEIACKTAPGTKDGSGNFLKLGPAASADHSADYRNTAGYILTGPEYFTIFDGRTGNELATVDYLPGRGTVSSWGDNYGNRVDRFLACVAYLDGNRPSVVMCRGYYTRTVLVAWDWRDNTLTKRWTFDSNNGYPTYAGQGNHGISVADVDKDGKDEIIYGACAIDDDGKGLWNSRLGHGDAMHVSDIIPDRPGLEVWGIHEQAQMGSALLDARTGEIIWNTGPGDVGRGVAADLIGTQFGMECWGGTDGLRSSLTNVKLDVAPSSSNHVIWWDGDLTRELLDGVTISKYKQSTLLNATQCASNNGTKSNPSLQADLFGDWREEVIWRTSDNTKLRIYTTTYLTEYRIKTLMHDPVYRLGIAWQNVAYNQPPHTGYFLGEGMLTPDSLRAPAPPTGLVASSTIDLVQLTWNKNLESDLKGYNLYRSDTVDGNYKLINSSLLTLEKFDDSNVLGDIHYYYVVKAVDTIGNESGASVPVVGFPKSRPDSPVKLKTTYGNSGAFIYWASNTETNIAGYNIYRSTVSGSGFVKINTLLITRTEFVNTGLTNGIEYFYVVTAMNNNNIESFYSAQVRVVPAAVVTLQAEDADFGNAVIETIHTGFKGSGYINFDTSSGFVEFKGAYAESAGWYYMIVRYALGNTDRTGRILVNGIQQSYTMVGTSAWTTFLDDTVVIKLNAGFDNIIRFESTGSDFGNLDEIRIGTKAAAPNGIEDLTGANWFVKISPNPFDNQTVISVTFEKLSFVTIDIFNGSGQKILTVANNQKVVLDNDFKWDGTDQTGGKVQNGIYFCRVVINNKRLKVFRIVYIK